MTVPFPAVRDMPWAEFKRHMKRFHPGLSINRRAHAGQHGHDYQGHTHEAPMERAKAPVPAKPPEEIVSVPAAREMMQWRFIKHVRLRHPDLRYATYDAHQIDHTRSHWFDHEHAPSFWATVPKGEALQEAASYRPPILPLAREMETGAFLRHIQDQHGQDFLSFTEHDREHEETPDQLDHAHKRREP